MSHEKSEHEEAVEVSAHEVTAVEVAFTEGASVWKRCPVDGTRFFEASETYPLGRPAGSRWCSSSCAAAARAALRRTGLASASPLLPRDIAARVEEEGILIREAEEQRAVQAQLREAGLLLDND